MWRLAWSVLLLAAGAQAYSNIDIPSCKGMKIGILDVTQFANPDKGFASCSKNYSEVVVNPANGIVYLNNATRDIQGGGVEHLYGTHSAPWYLRETIKNSKYYVENIEDADIVYVDDYCYYIWWLGDIHYRGRKVTDTPGDYLMMAWQAMVELPRWKRNHGKDFVFYDSHPGFAAGDAGHAYQNFKCHNLRNSTNLIVDTPMRYVCGRGWPWNKLFVTPYVPNRVDMREPAAHLKTPSPGLSERSILAYHRATCAKVTHKGNGFNAGKMIRNYLAFAYMQEPRDVQVKCVNHDHPTAVGGGGGVSFDRMFAHMQKTVFCLVLAGDAASTRRFSEIMMAGCIPTFIGPPYHSMPFIEDIDYRNGAVFFNVTDYSPWQPTPMELELDPKQRADHETEARWWVPDADISSRAIVVKDAEKIISVLRNIPVTEVKQKLEIAAEVRSAFSFDTELTDPPNAVNVLLSGICRRAPQDPIG